MSVASFVWRREDSNLASGGISKLKRQLCAKRERSALGSSAQPAILEPEGGPAVISIAGRGNEFSIGLADHSIWVYRRAPGDVRYLKDKHPLSGHVSSPFLLEYCKVYFEGRIILASGCLGGRVIVWDTQKMVQIHKIDLPGSKVSSLSFLHSPITPDIVIGSASKVLRWRWYLDNSDAKKNHHLETVVSLPSNMVVLASELLLRWDIALAAVEILPSSSKRFRRYPGKLGRTSSRQSTAISIWDLSKMPTDQNQSLRMPLTDLSNLSLRGRTAEVVTSRISFRCRKRRRAEANFPRKMSCLGRPCKSFLHSIDRVHLCHQSGLCIMEARDRLACVVEDRSGKNRWVEIVSLSRANLGQVLRRMALSSNSSVASMAFSHISRNLHVIYCVTRRDIRQTALRLLRDGMDSAVDSKQESSADMEVSDRRNVPCISHEAYTLQGNLVARWRSSRESHANVGIRVEGSLIVGFRAGVLLEHRLY